MKSILDRITRLERATESRRSSPDEFSRAMILGGSEPWTFQRRDEDDDQHARMVAALADAQAWLREDSRRPHDPNAFGGLPLHIMRLQYAAGREVQLQRGMIPEERREQIAQFIDDTRYNAARHYSELSDEERAALLSTSP